MDDKKYYIYKLTDPEGKVYIGSTMQKPKERWEGGSGYSGQPFHSAIKKFGWSNFDKKILEVVIGKENAGITERKYISYYNSTNPNFGYNIENGGNKGKKLADETKQKISKTLKLKGIIPPSRKGAIGKNRKCVLQYDLFGNFIAEYSSQLEASIALGVHVMTISDAVNGRTKTCKGYILKRKAV